jgi:steroid 5-alpha reductase family enzyme
MLELFLISIAINLLMFIPAYRYKTDKLTDLSYALSFIVLSTIAFISSQKELTHLLLLVMVVIWATRLGGFLFLRIRKLKRDKRFDEMRNSIWKFGRFWLLQGVSVFVILLASLFVWRRDVAVVSWLSWVGVVVFLCGLLLESTADYQKRKFSSKVENKDKWIDSGLWSVSRHPNYLGEMMVWIGVYIYTFSSLVGSEKVISLLSPLYIVSLLLFVSGIPLLEKAAEKKWGENEEYKKYKKRTSVLLPKIINKTQAI